MYEHTLAFYVTVGDGRAMVSRHPWVDRCRGESWLCWWHVRVEHPPHADRDAMAADIMDLLRPHMMSTPGSCPDVVVEWILVGPDLASAA